MEVYDADEELSQSAHRTFNFILRNSPTMGFNKIHYKTKHVENMTLNYG